MLRNGSQKALQTENSREEVGPSLAVMILEPERVGINLGFHILIILVKVLPKLINEKRFGLRPR